MPGDKITAKVYAKYVDASAPDVQQALLTFLTALGTGGAGDPLIDGVGPGSLGGAIFPYADYLEREDDGGTAPKAYLNYLVFDRDFNFLNGGYKPLTTNARETANLLPEGVGHDTLAFEDGEIKITEPGFVYIYFSNENESRMEVFFDDFEVTHVKSPVVQVDDYYPFGLTFNSYQREHALDQKYQYNSKEKQDVLGLNWLDYGARMYIPEIGKFNRQDLFSGESQSCSPYSYAENDPVNFIDMGGNFKFSVEFRTKYPRVTAWLEKNLPNFQNNQHIMNTIYYHNHLSDNDIKDSFKNGSGPTLGLLQKGDAGWGRTYDIGDIRINQSDLVDLLERGIAAGGAEWKGYNDLHKFQLLVTILHELIHEGSRRTGYKLAVGIHQDNPDQDEGDNWEIQTFGRMSDRVFKAGGKSDNPRVRDSAESFREENPIFFYLFINEAPHGNTEDKNKKKGDADRRSSDRSGGG